MNNTTITILKQKKIQIVFLFYMVLLLPLLSPLAENIPLKTAFILILINGLLYFSIAFLTVFCSSRVEKIVYTIIFIVSYLPFSIYTSYLLFAGVLLQKNSIISLFETNPEESKEFLAHYFNPWIIVAFVIYILVCFLIIWTMKKTKRLEVKKHRAIFYTSLITFCIILITPPLSKNVYFVNFYQIFVKYKIKQKEEEVAIVERQILPYDVALMKKDSIPQTIVVVIGESLGRSHMSLYGYDRPTNPELSKFGDSLFTYTDVVSPQVHTIPVMRTVLTLFDKDLPNNIIEKPSLFELFNRAGYETFFISNQPFGGPMHTSYDDLLNLSKQINDLSGDHQQDEIVLPVIDDILQNTRNKNKIILVHLIGNHMAYEFRYTPSYNVFDNNDDKKIATNRFRDKKAIRIIDKYDNSVLYNDYVVSSILKMLKDGDNKQTAFLYFSDHGEEVYDMRKFSGHAYEKASTYMCEIPFMMWLSPDYIKGRPDLVIDTKRPFSTANFLQSLTDLAGITYLDNDKSKSLFSRDYKPSERFIGNYTYEELLQKEKSK